MKRRKKIAETPDPNIWFLTIKDSQLALVPFKKKKIKTPIW